ncbi:MAG: lipocalin family protein [Ferruginibacter sp.]
MNRLNPLLKVLPFFLLLCSCSSSNPEYNKLIIGNWSGAEWLIDGKESNRDIQNTHFSFDEKGTYTFEYSGTKEEGSYKIENDMLFTTPAGKQEIMVKIQKLTMDSLLFDMNRAGQAELLTLRRK